VAVLAFAVLPLLGCASAAAPALAPVFTDVTGPVAYGNNGKITKTGKACAKSYLGLIAQGDASIQAAMKEGGIRNVVMVDHQSKIILMLYAEYCTIVRGS